MVEAAFPKAGSAVAESEWSQILGKLYHAVEDGLGVTADGGGLRVFLAAGRAGVRGHGYQNTASLEIPIDAGDSQPRTDVIVLRLDYTQTPIIQAVVVKGTAGAGVPSLTQTVEGIYEFPLAHVNVPANAVTITSGDVVGVAITMQQALKAFLNIAMTDLNGVLSAGQIPNLNASKINAGTFALERIPTLDAGRIPDIDASKIATGTLADARIPSLNASKIATGTLDAARVPALDASKMTSGVLADARIPSLAASKITSGTFALARIPVLDAGRVPALDAGKITSGTFALARIPTLDAGRIPNLDASKITSGTFADARIPNLNASKITSGTLPHARGGTGATTALGAREGMLLYTGNGPASPATNSIRFRDA